MNGQYLILIAEAIAAVIAEAKDGARIVDLCTRGDKLVTT